MRGPQQFMLLVLMLCIWRNCMCQVQDNLGIFLNAKAATSGVSSEPGVNRLKEITPDTKESINITIGFRRRYSLRVYQNGYVTFSEDLRPTLLGGLPSRGVVSETVFAMFSVRGVDNLPQAYYRKIEYPLGDCRDWLIRRRISFQLKTIYDDYSGISKIISILWNNIGQGSCTCELNIVTMENGVTYVVANYLNTVGYCVDMSYNFAGYINQKTKHRTPTIIFRRAQADTNINLKGSWLFKLSGSGDDFVFTADKSRLTQLAQYRDRENQLRFQCCNPRLAEKMYCLNGWCQKFGEELTIHFKIDDRTTNRTITLNPKGKRVRLDNNALTIEQIITIMILKIITSSTEADSGFETLLYHTGEHIHMRLELAGMSKVSTYVITFDKKAIGVAYVQSRGRFMEIERDSAIVALMYTGLDFWTLNAKGSVGQCMCWIHMKCDKTSESRFSTCSCLSGYHLHRDMRTCGRCDCKIGQTCDADGECKSMCNSQQYYEDGKCKSRTCSRNTQCHASASCITGICRCNSGLQGNGVTKCEILECNCPPGNKCNDAGDCVEGCPPGQTLRDGQCQSLCGTNQQTRCHDYADCKPFSIGESIGRCLCRDGFTGDGITSCKSVCSETCIDEETCDPQTRKCKSICPPLEYYRDGRCLSIRCGSSGSAQCHRFAACMGMITNGGDYVCRCRKGYEGDGVTKCAACTPSQVYNKGRCVNKMCNLNGPSTCHEKAKCVRFTPTTSNGRCKCNEGLEGDGIIKCEPLCKQTCEEGTKCSRTTRRCESICTRHQYYKDGKCEPLLCGKSKPLQCHENAICKLVGPNAPIGYCRCLDNFEGNGVTKCTSVCKETCEEGTKCSGTTRKCESICREKFYYDDGKCKSLMCRTTGQQLDVAQCHKNAICKPVAPNAPVGLCQCLYNYVGNGVTRCTSPCQPVCSYPYKCNERRVCVQRCKSGWFYDGEKCKEAVCGVTPLKCHPSARCLPKIRNKPIGICTCMDGLKGDGVNNCTADDPCKLCHRNAHCQALGEAKSCRCNNGYEGDGTQCDLSIKPCKQTCNVNGKCVRDDSGTGSKCMCNLGYHGDGNQCADIRGYCRQGCPQFAKCVQAKCVCDYGRRLQSSRCEKVSSSCDTNTRVCHKYAACRINRLGDDPSHICECGQGMYGSAYDTCSKIQESGVCSAPCAKDAYCLENNCKCKPGFKGDGYVCTSEDIPCTRDSDCPSYAVCKPNQLTMKTCQCLVNYKMYKRRCLRTPILSVEYRERVNEGQPTKVVCTAVRGFEDIDLIRFVRASDGTPIKGRHVSQVDNGKRLVISRTKMSHSADYYCLAGPSLESYIARTPFTLEVIKQWCTDKCHANAYCVKHEGRCMCNPTFMGDGVRKCTPAPPCGTADNPVTNCHRYATCNVTSSQCECLPDFEGSGYDCVKKRSCGTDNPCDANFKCIPHKSVSDYSYCYCDMDKYIYNGKTCEFDKRPCNQNKGKCPAHATCTPRPDDTYTCKCVQGFVGNGTVDCEKIVDCTVPQRCGSQGTCKSRFFGTGDLMYKQGVCHCYDGFKEVGGKCAKTSIADKSLFVISGPCIARLPTYTGAKPAAQYLKCLDGVRYGVAVAYGCVYGGEEYLVVSTNGATDNAMKAYSIGRSDGRLVDAFTYDIDKTATEVEGVALDPVAGNVFYTDSKRRQIRVFTLDGSVSRTLKTFSDDQVMLRGIALDLVGSYIYYADWNRKGPAIYRIPMNGQGESVKIVSVPNGLPNDLVVTVRKSASLLERQVCWIQTSKSVKTPMNLTQINCIPFDGKKPAVSKYIKTVGHPFALSSTPTGDAFFWTDWESKTVFSYLSHESTQSVQTLKVPTGSNGRNYGIAYRTGCNPDLVYQSQCKKDTCPGNICLPRTIDQKGQRMCFEKD